MTNPKNARSTARGRVYRWRDEEFTSVTTIISGGVPKPALVNWSAKRVAEVAVAKQRIWAAMDTPADKVDWLKRAPYREKESAAIQGSAVHAWAEKWALGLPVTVEELPEEQQPYAESFLQFVHDLAPTWEMSEASVYNRRHAYAGTLDALMHVILPEEVIEALLVATGWDFTGLGLVDYKTSKGIYGETALQLAAYRHAEFVGLPDGTEVPMLPVEWCAILHITDKGYQLVPVDAGPLAFEYFLAAQRVRDFCEDISRTALLPAVSLPQPEPRPSAPVHTAALVD